MIVKKEEATAGIRGLLNQQGQALFDVENAEAYSCCWPTHKDSADERVRIFKQKGGMQG